MTYSLKQISQTLSSSVARSVLMSGVQVVISNTFCERRVSLQIKNTHHTYWTSHLDICLLSIFARSDLMFVNWQINAQPSGFVLVPCSAGVLGAFMGVGVPSDTGLVAPDIVNTSIDSVRFL